MENAKDLVVFRARMLGLVSPTIAPGRTVDSTRNNKQLSLINDENDITEGKFNVKSRFFKLTAPSTILFLAKVLIR